MRFQLVTAISCVTIFMAIVSGCGGGSNSSPTPTPSVSPIPISTRLRELHPGLYWNYSIKYTYKQPGHATIIEDSICSVGINDGYNNGKHYLDLTESDTLGGIPGISVTRYGQRTSLDNALVRFPDGYPIFDRPIVTIPGNWAQGISDSGTLVAKAPPNFRFNYSYFVVGQETVTVPAGTFETWKTIRTEYNRSGTYWYAPQIGNYVKAEYDDKIPAGINDSGVPYKGWTNSYSLELRDTNAL